VGCQGHSCCDNGSSSLNVIKAEMTYWVIFKRVSKAVAASSSEVDNTSDSKTLEDIAITDQRWHLEGGKLLHNEKNAWSSSLLLHYKLPFTFSPQLSRTTPYLGHCLHFERVSIDALKKHDAVLVPYFSAFYFLVCC